MPFYQRGDVRIHYEEAGSGFPLLIIPGGGLNATIAYLRGSAPFDPMQEFKDEYRCISMDLRNAKDGQSSGPLDIDRPWDAYTDDQLGLMDHLGIDRFLVLGFCIGGPFIWNLLRRAPERVLRRRADAAQRLSPGDAGPVLREQHQGLGAAAVRPPVRRHDGHGQRVPEQDVSLQPGFRVHRYARLRARLPDADPGPAGRYAATPLRGGHGVRAAGAERPGQPLSVEGLEGEYRVRGAARAHVSKGEPARRRSLREWQPRNLRRREGEKAW